MNTNPGTSSSALAQAVIAMRASFDQRVREGQVTDAFSADEAAAEIAAEVAERFALGERDAAALSSEAMKYGGDEFPPSDGG